jgi:hypothetical protein
MKPYERASDELLMRIRDGMASGEIFASTDIRRDDLPLLPQIFIAVGACSHAKLFFLKYAIVFFWAWKRDATGEKLGQYDVYPGCGMLDADDFDRLREMSDGLEV